jgi:hyperosmotically inducible protein
MRAIQFRPISAGVLSAVALVALGACSPSDREQARTDTNRATQTARTETSKAVAGAEKALDDATLTTKVKTALLADSQVKGTQINVDSNNGIVTLSGSVATKSEKMRAEQLAQNVDGVKAVTNNLTAPQ